MEPEEECFCNNCKRYVSSANFAVHSAFCERNIFVCKICGEPVQVSEKDQHLDEYHVVSPCKLCEAPIEKWMLPKHMELCPKRLVACMYCEAEFLVHEHSEHVEFCGSRTEKCLLCHKYVMIKEKTKHDELHALEKQFHAKNTEDEIKQNKVNEVMSRKGPTEKVPEKMSETIGNWPPNINERGDSCGVNESENKIHGRGNCDIPIHEGAGAHLPAKEISKMYTKCHICKDIIPWIDFNIHVPNCATSLGKCSLCGESVPSHEIKEHMKKHTQSRVGSQSFKVSQNESHYETTYRSHQSDAAKSKIHDAVKCPYCSEHYTEDQIVEHTRSCPRNFSKSSQSFFECPLCGKEIPEEDGNQHMTLLCEKLFNVGTTHSLYAVGEDSYECPYCLEKMPQKDKKMHQNFYCKVLIENCGVDLNDSDSCADGTKKANHSNNKVQKCEPSCETCPTCKNKFCKEKISEHMKKCCRLKEPCIFCKTMIDTNCRDIHITYCPGIDNRDYPELKRTVSQNSKLSNFKQKGAIPKNMNIHEMMKPRSAKCTYCCTEYNVDILPNHEKECVHMPIHCEHCKQQIFLKDVYTHKCKQKKGKYKMQQHTSEGNDNSFWTKWNKTKKFFMPKDEKEVKSKQMGVQITNYYESDGYVPDSVKNKENAGKLYFEQTDETLLPCEFCQQEFPASELVLHETGCQPDLVSYAKPSSPEKSDSSQYSVKKDLVPTSRSENIHAAGGVNHPFFTENSFLAHDVSENIEHNGKTNDKCDKLSQLKKNAKGNENAGVEKKPFNLQSVWNVGNSCEFPTEFPFKTDDLKEILNNSDVDKTEETAYLTERQNEKKELDQQSSDKHSPNSNEMKTLLKFLNKNVDEKSESSEEFLSLSDENGEIENSEREANSSMNSKNSLQERQGGSALSKKVTNEERSKEVQQDFKFSGEVEKNPEYLEQLAGFRFGASKTTFPSRDNEHCDIQSKKIDEELEDPSRCSEKPRNQKKHVISLKDFTDLKLSSYQFVALSGDANVNEMIDEDPEKLSKQKATKFPESCDDQRNFTNFEQNAYCPEQTAKNYDEPKKLHKEKISGSNFSTNDVKVNASSFKYFADFKNDNGASTVLSDGLERFKMLHEMHNKESKGPYTQNNSRCSGTTVDDPEKLSKQKAIKSESSNDQRNYTTFEQNTYCPGQTVKNYDEPKNLHKGKISGSNFSTNDVKENVSSFKYFADFKNDNGASTVLSDGLERFKMLHEMHNKDSKEPYTQNKPRCFGTTVDDQKYICNYRQHLPKLHQEKFPENNFSANDIKGNISSFKYFTDCKNDNDVSAVLSDEFEQLKMLHEKHNKEPKEPYNQNNPRCFGTTVDDQEYIRNYKQHLPDFKFSFLEPYRKSSQENAILPESRSGHNVDQAFVLEPAGYQKGSKHLLHTALKTEVKKVGLYEKIAALEQSKEILGSVTNNKFDDVTKWKMWRNEDHNSDSD